MQSDDTPAIPEGFAALPLIEGGITVVDSDIAERFQGATISGSTGYARLRVGSRWVPLHRIIAETPDDLVTDHINGIPLDNRRCNLRSVTVSENMANRRKKRASATSRFKGVSWHCRIGKWVARIRYCGKEHAIGQFDQEEAAARAYDDLALQLWGDKASLNFGNPLSGSVAVDQCRDQLPCPRKRGTSHPGSSSS